MTQHRFTQLDVFSNQPLMGNPLAVVHDADDLSPAQMAQFARWTNLSETTFLLKPETTQADYRVRIFTPNGELPFAGHPTLGSCAAWLAAGGQPRQAGHIVQACGIGLVNIRVEGERLAFAAPTLRRTGELEASLLEQIAQGLRVSHRQLVAHQWVDNGPGFCAVMLEEAEHLRRLKPDFARLAHIKLGVIAPQTPGHDTAFEVRAFVVPSGVNEDPVTGSLNAGLSVWMRQAGLAPSPHYVVAQGHALGRSGRVYIDHDGDDIWVGGSVVVGIQGRLQLP